MIRHHSEKQMAKKPTGSIGPISVTSTPTGAVGAWNKVEFPKDKEGIEKLVVEMWANATRSAGGTILEIIPNKQNDFDFTLVLPGGKVSMDLVEFIYRDGQGKPYDSDQIEIQSFDYAKQLVATVMEKSAHYGKAGTQSIHLLIYITHWRFWSNEVAIRLAQHFLSESPPIFENVFFVEPLDAIQGNARVLYPSRNPMEGHKPEDFKEHFTLTLNPGNWTIASDGKLR
jgi:hypothetical protein